MNKSFTAVHIGAGYHGPDKAQEYQRVCSVACQKAELLLSTGCSALQGVVAAVQFLEDTACTNAGHGSNLTLDGGVECDASVMDGRTRGYGAVGSLTGIQNPVTVAAKLVEMQTREKMSCGRVPPSVLVGAGAHKWAKTHGFKSVPTSSLISDRSLRTFSHHKLKLEKSEIRRSKKRKQCEPSEETPVPVDPANAGQTNTADVCAPLDTVGAICVDQHGNMATAISSGGISLKHPGRVGQAMMFGCGCWASNGTSSEPGVATTTSGCGEQLISTMLARVCAESLQTSDNCSMDMAQTFKDKFLCSEMLHNYPEKLGGVLAVRLDKTPADSSSTVEVLWIHSTDSMGAGYMKEGEKPQSFISRLPVGVASGQNYTIEGKQFSL